MPNRDGNGQKSSGGCGCGGNKNVEIQSVKIGGCCGGSKHDNTEDSAQTTGGCCGGSGDDAGKCC